jgi:plasmid stability protein
MHFDNLHAFTFENTQVAMLTVRNLPDEVHRALKMRAALHGHGTEAEVREILASSVKPSP